MTTREPTRRRRWPWLLSSLLLVAAAAVAAVSTYLHWLPCRGSMFEETMFDISSGGVFSDACLRRMDGGTPFPFTPEPAEQARWAAELGALAMALAALAWIPPLAALRWSGRSRWAAAVPLVLSLLVAGSCLVAARNPDRVEKPGWSLWVWGATEVAAVAALVVITRAEELELTAVGQLLVLGWGATAFGALHQALDFGVAISLSGANWDVPPGTGYGTVVGLVVVALVVAAAGRSGPETAADPGAAQQQPLLSDR